MSNSIYRLLMRWCYKTLYPLLSPQIHTRRFGERQGVSTAHATQTFLNDMDSDVPWEGIFAFDMYHAFDSPPKILIREVLDRMGTPLHLLLLISTVLDHGSTFIRGSPDSQFTTTHGVKQGCPMSCLLFVLVFEISLRFFQSQGLVFSAYVDDVSVHVPRGAGPRIAATVQQGLALIGCNSTLQRVRPCPYPSPVPPHRPYPSTPSHHNLYRPVQISGPQFHPSNCQSGQTIRNIY